MNNTRKIRFGDSEHSYWQSYSDMMAALMLIFILIIAITLSIYKQKTTDLEQTKIELNSAKEDLEVYRAEIEQSNQELANSLLELEDAYNKTRQTEQELQSALSKAQLTESELANAYLEIEQAKSDLAAAYESIDASQAELTATKTELANIVGIRADIIGELQSKFANSTMKVDPQTGSIVFSSDVLFDYGRATLTKKSQDTLRSVIPTYLDVLMQDQFKDYIAEIIIEGHTDTSGSYASNLELSAKRANAVADFCLNEKNGLSTDKIDKLRSVLTVNGRSYSSPIYSKTNPEKVDMAASRRVEIKFRLKEDEMIDKITEILNK